MDRRTFIKTGAAAAFAMAQDSSRDNHTPVRPLTIAEAKQGLALKFGVAPEAIDIVIKG